MLNNRQIDILNLYYFENYTQEMIAELFKISQSAVSQTISTAKRKVKAKAGYDFVHRAHAQTAISRGVLKEYYNCANPGSKHD